MNSILKGKWIVLVLWIAAIVGLFMIAPNMGDLVREKGQVSVPDTFSSAKATEIMDEIQSQENQGDQSSVALVFHSSKKLTAEEKAETEKAVKKLEADKEKLGITEILSSFTDESLKDQLVSDDGKTILVSLKVSWNDREAEEVSKALYDELEEFKVDHYYTSNWMIDQDLTTSSEEGLKKTEGITVVFILAVLLIVFRSVIAPFIPLITVGLSYLASQSIVSILVDKFDFPISNYTQIFLVAVLFGIGTDYCILLLSRFKEEMMHSESIAEAIVETYRNAGRTVLFSGIAVMIGFAAIGFSQFKLYQSASAVAVGVALLLVALFTVVPAIMVLLGKKIFWPSKGSAEHGDSKIWEIAGRFSIKRPIIALAIVAAITVPFLVTYDGTLSFNSLDEIGDDAPSIKAFNAIADSFGPGESMTTTITIKNDEEMDSIEYLGLAENISKELEKVDLVKDVRSVTRPTGEPIEDLYISKQAETLEEGLGEGKDGIDQISDGLHEAGDQLSKSGPQLNDATSGINDLIKGTDEVKTNLGTIQTNLAKIEDGIRQGSAGSDEIKAGLETAKSGAEDLLKYHQQLLAGYEQTESNLSTLLTNYKKTEDGLKELNDGFAKIEPDYFTGLEQRYNGISSDLAYKGIKEAVQGAQNNLPNLYSGIMNINAGLVKLQAGVSEANNTYGEILENQAAVSTGLEQLIAGIEQQQAGLNQLADGQGQIVDNMPKLTGGLTSISDGQKQLLDGFGDINGQLGDLTEGLNQSADGLDQVSDGLNSATDYLSGLSKNDQNQFYLPEEVLESDDFQGALDAYLSKNNKIMTMDVVFSANPYSNEAINQIDDIKDTVERATTGTKLENAEVAVGGITSTNADLRTMSNQDYSKTVLWMLVGIGIVLIFLFRSIIMPAYIIGSLILTFYTAMGINEAIYVNLLGYTGISWAVPFFGFVILVALGVDYSIFLMDRFNEYRDLSIGEAMLEAMKKMGTVIISAAVILGGTFAAMMPSGMLSLLQIASIVLVGLFLYALIILPLFIPVMVKNFGEANWWPFKRPNNE
ncbi:MULTISPECIES: MMPL family transporter [unclassified Niallia]|uniref:MMPL family transporter n=1 Tax=unclassified Niallia TaxID=2837522 RepID=UPI001EDB3963|nr:MULTISPECIES: MMPL family transporter [unclassified Niallia]MDL0435182.1 MMPL family transporter [Niallia sp. SS-2023]UPO87052.1 MMPL family transporter [Niallia sp. Man26]